MASSSAGPAVFSPRSGRIVTLRGSFPHRSGHRVPTAEIDLLSLGSQASGRRFRRAGPVARDLDLRQSVTASRRGSSCFTSLAVLLAPLRARASCVEGLPLAQTPQLPGLDLPDEPADPPELGLP